MQTVGLGTLHSLIGKEAEWQNLLSCCGKRNNFNDINWYRLRIKTDRAEPLILSCINQGNLECFLPCEKKEIDLNLSISERKIIRFPFKALDVMGNSIVGKEATEWYEAIFKYFFSECTSSDLIYFSQIPVGSFLYQYLHSSKLIRAKSIVYKPFPNTPRYFIDVSNIESIHPYLAGLSGKKRRQLKRLKRRLEDKIGNTLKVDSYTSPDSVSEFIKKSKKISERTWQHKTIGNRIGFKDLSQSFLEVVAKEGWLRSYILTCGDNNIAFLVAYQFDQCLYLREIGYDPSWGSFSPGNLLLLSVIEDAITIDEISTADFGYGEAQYKKIFANHLYQETPIYLFRKNFRNSFLVLSHKIIMQIHSRFSWIIEKMRLKKRVRKIVRGN